MPTFYQRFQETASRFPNNIALEIQRAGGTDPAATHPPIERVTFAELALMAESVGNWLSTRVPRDARIAILAANHPRWVAAYLGIIAAGRTAVPLDTASHAEQVKTLLLDSGASLLFCDAKHLPIAIAAVQSIPAPLVTMSHSHGLEPPSSAAKSRSPEYSPLTDLDSIFAQGPANFVPVVPREDDLAALLYTSGTTADPKGVMLTHANLIAEANAVFSVFTIGPDDALLGILPMFHVLAQMANLFLPLFNGARVVYLETLNTTELLRALRERDITTFAVVPQFFYLIHERIFQQINQRGRLAQSIVRALMALNRALRKVGLNAGKLFFGKIHHTFGTRMRYLVTGGSRFDPAIQRAFYSFGIDVLNAYGLTETTGGAFVNRPHEIAFGSVGPPLPEVEVRIIDPLDVDPLEVDPTDSKPDLLQAGEIVLRGPLIMKGYWNRPDATAEVLRDGWLYTGDLGYVDSVGNLFITGRRKEVIVLANGKNIYPEEVETHYLKSPYIKELCVMAVEARPGDPTSERLHAVVVPNFDLLRQRHIVNTKEIVRSEIEALSHKIASTKRLGSYDIWQQDLPRTTTRKLKRYQIEANVRALKSRELNAREPRSQTTPPGALSDTPNPLSAEETAWLARDDVRQGLAIIREASRSDLVAILPAHNLELDLGLDSMQRIELLSAIEQRLGGDVQESDLAAIYTVRELVDAVLASAGSTERHSKASPTAWAAILNEPVTDPGVLALAQPNSFAEVSTFALSRLIYLLSTDLFQFKVRGLENLPASGPCLLCSNHQSYIDPILLGSALPWRLFRDAFSVGTSEIFGSGFLRRLARWIRVVVLDPDANLVPAMRAAAFGLRQGRPLILYPEGERTNTGELRIFRKGAAILSIHTQTPIVPIAINGFYAAWPRHKKFPRLTDLQMEIGKPLFPPPPEEASEATYDRLTSTVKSEIARMFADLKEEGRLRSKAALD